MPIDSNTIKKYTIIIFGISFAKNNNNAATIRKN